MFTNQALKHADACRFCWMCRHICPVGQVTGKEGNNARPKGLLVSLDHRGIPLDESAMELMYECTLCRGCAHHCETGFDPVIYILEARTKAVVEDLLPPNVKAVLERTLGGSAIEAEEADEITEAVAALPEKADVLVYLGETARKKQPAIALAFMDLLKKAGITFTVLKEEPQSGALLAEIMGYVEDVKNVAKACADTCRETGAGTIVVLDESDAAFMKHQWAEWQLFDGDIVTATACTAELIETGKLKPGSIKLRACYHDPAMIAREVEETEPARKIISAMGIDLHELFRSRKTTKSSGGTLLSLINPEMARMVAEGRLGDVSFAGENAVITSTPTAFDNFSKVEQEDIKIDDLFTLLDSVC